MKNTNNKLTEENIKMLLHLKIAQMLNIFVVKEDIARYSVLHDNERLFMSKYLTYLPTKEQLKAEIEHQKELFYMQHPTLQNCI